MEGRVRIFKKVITVLLIIFIQEIYPLPTNNYYDSFIFYNARGTDKFYRKNKGQKILVELSPYFQSVSGCRGLKGSRVLESFSGKEGTRLGEGDRLGIWNFLGLFYGRDASPDKSKFELITATDSDPDGITKDNEKYKRYPDLVIAGAVLDNNHSTFLNEDAFGTQANGDSQNDILLRDFTDEEKFIPSSLLGRVSVPIDFEKYGLRGKFDFLFGSSFGASVRWGICHYRQRPKFEDFTAEANDSSSEGGNLTTSVEVIQRYLTRDYIRDKVLDDVGIDIKTIEETALEDMHMGFYFIYPIALQDKEGDHFLSVAPYLSLGFWLPTGKQRNQDEVFSLSTGNDGFFGVSCEGSINFDFPGMVQLAFGGGLAAWLSRNRHNFRVPSSEYQYGIYPWKIDVSHRPGVSWYTNISIQSEKFLETFSFYFDFIWTWHERDSLKIHSTKAPYFKIDKFKKESYWRSQLIFGGVELFLTDAVQLGFAFQTVLSGLRVYRTTTALFSMTFNF